MTREQAETMISKHLFQIADIITDYYPKDGYFHVGMDLREGYIRFNNADWEHAVGKLNKTLFRKGGEWHDAKLITRDTDVQGKA